MDPQRLQILIATTDEQVLEDLAGILSRQPMGADLLRAESPATTSDALAEDESPARPDFLFLDVDLGEDTVRRILADEGSERVPVVAIAADEGAAVDLFENHRLHDILVKPLSEEQVHRVLSYYDEV